MSWTITNDIVQVHNTLYCNCMGVADASDLADEVLVNKSDYAMDGPDTLSHLRVMSFKAWVFGVILTLEWEHTTDDVLIVVPGSVGACVDTLVPPGLPNVKNGVLTDLEATFTEDPESSGGSGDLVATTTGGAAGDGFLLQMVINLIKA